MSTNPTLGEDGEGEREQNNVPAYPCGKGDHVAGLISAIDKGKGSASEFLAAARDLKRLVDAWGNDPRYAGASAGLSQMASDVSFLVYALEKEGNHYFSRVRNELILLDESVLPGQTMTQVAIYELFTDHLEIAGMICA